MKKIVACGMAMVCAVGLVLQAQALETGQAAPDFVLKDGAGNEHKLSDHKGKHVVLEWTNYGCPFVKKHYSQGDMQALQAKYTGKDVVWLSICSSAPGNQGHYSAEDVGEVVEEQKAKCTAYLLDEDGVVGKQYGAKTTPHIFIVGPEQTLIYQGAIDSIRSTDTDDVATAENYVVKTLDAAMAGESVDPTFTQSYGCPVKY